MLFSAPHLLFKVASLFDFPPFFVLLLFPLSTDNFNTTLFFQSGFNIRRTIIPQIPHDYSYQGEHCETNSSPEEILSTCVLIDGLCLWLIFSRGVPRFVSGLHLGVLANEPTCKLTGTLKCLSRIFTRRCFVFVVVRSLVAQLVDGVEMLDGFPGKN
ncbi:hypothetical protein DAA51_39065 [Bradyrhizobium sp. WBAH10]|nr:hypothetical protein [Bradyrhizobium sp. WBAH30]MDD1547740.1 hypothetical protein [Bradyrhizobium sp. WBAH41]MDD1561383.1 hypothetical protein [Bradyrhizobium sp. WBAH23]MDD1568823.1 hypothetical protein [Bradyrhizobium sp. WBAH33]MDD1594793.1 hypothetical protein [Bradyrhizobium sp. WBAH42]NRB92343.1 hypothetical protein [Bradyrhizobium sp. WBAH10]QCJ93674.1 hypothetical protein DAA57_38960 [Bradyrhizobium yuanmingense]